MLSPALHTVTTKSFETLCSLRPRIVAIAASTGGPEALRTVLSPLKGKIVHTPIAITQHLGADFSSDFVLQIEKISGMATHIAEDDLVVMAGHIYIAGGGKHMQIIRKHDRKVVMANDGAPEHHCKPSVNPMLRSIADVYGDKMLAITLTGMGEDGIEGARNVVEKGGTMVVQDQASSRVWGMPKAVHDAGLAHATLPLNDIAKLLIKIIT